MWLGLASLQSSIKPTQQEGDGMASAHSRQVSSHPSHGSGTQVIVLHGRAGQAEDTDTVISIALASALSQFLTQNVAIKPDVVMHFRILVL